MSGVLGIELEGVKNMRTVSTLPLVSIVVPSFNCEEFITDALESCLKQSYKNIEVICVDDSSSDKTATIAEAIAAKDSRLRVIRRDMNGGVSRAFNSGFKAAGGHYLTRLACDDVFYPNAIRIMAEMLDTVKGIDLVYCDMNQIDEGGHVLSRIITNPPASALLPQNRLGLCVMWTRTLMNTIGWFDPRCDLAEDYDFWLRASLRFKFRKIQATPQLGFRLHKNQSSVTKYLQQNAIVIRVHVLHRWRCVKQEPLMLGRWIKLLRSEMRFALFALTQSRVRHKNSPKYRN